MLTDGRFSGGTSGLSIGHVSPEAAEGGAIGLVEEGDRIEIDIRAAPSAWRSAMKRWRRGARRWKPRAATRGNRWAATAWSARPCAPTRR